MDNPADFRRRAQACRDIAARDETAKGEFLKAAELWEAKAIRAEFLLRLIKPE